MAFHGVRACGCSRSVCGTPCEARTRTPYGFSFSNCHVCQFHQRGVRLYLVAPRTNPQKRHQAAARSTGRRQVRCWLYGWQAVRITHPPDLSGRTRYRVDAARLTVDTPALGGVVTNTRTRTRTGPKTPRFPLAAAAGRVCIAAGPRCGVFLPRAGQGVGGFLTPSGRTPGLGCRAANRQ
jgi:hypothetical protein